MAFDLPSCTLGEFRDYVSWLAGFLRVPEREALAVALELGQYSPAAYAATKKQLHRPARAAIDAGAATDADVRASWISEETRGRIAGFLETLARGR